MPLLDRAEPVDRAGLEEHRLDERGLPRSAVAGDGDVADLSGLGGHLRTAPPRTGTRQRRSYPRSGSILGRAMWWRDAVVYQIYPRSFQDSDGDGVGDLRGIAQRLDYLAWLGVDAFWLSPIYPSPLADFGYDVSDYTAVDPQFGSLEDFDELVAAAHERGLRVLLDLDPQPHLDRASLVPRASRLVHLVAGRRAAEQLGLGLRRARLEPRRAERALVPAFLLPGAARPRLAQPGGRRARCRTVVRFWLERGVDGFRVDAIDRHGQGRRAARRAAGDEAFPFPLHPDAAGLERRYSVNRPEVVEALRAIREAAGDALLVGRGLPAGRRVPALPRGARPRLLVRVALLALGRGAAACRDRAGGGARPGGVGDVEPRLRPARDPRRAREPPRRRCPAADASRSRLRLPGRRDRPGERARRRPALRPGRPRRTAPPDGVGRRANRRLHDRASRGCRRSTRRNATSTTSAATPGRCSSSTAA